METTIPSGCFHPGKPPSATDKTISKMMVEKMLAANTFKFSCSLRCFE
jgi:hypothetical protein